MIQVFQSLSTGDTEAVDVPVPALRPGCVLVRTTHSLISTGTERMLVDFGKSNLIKKSLQQPDKVSEVLSKMRSDGFLSTVDAVRSKLQDPLPLGYCNVGVIVEIGEGVCDFSVGDRVVSNGYHAEYVSVPTNLCALIPPSVTDETAVFTVLGSIALQGIRLLKPTFGETIVVSGLGLLGLLSCQLLAAHGCRVLAIDPDPHKCKVAEDLGFTVHHLSLQSDPASWLSHLTGSLGVDAFLITAATASSQPIDLAAESCRMRGRIVLVGSTGLQLKREPFYKKELTFQVSCSYGPGRYDSSYESGGIDYPFGLVRWTLKRNFQAILNAFSCKQLNVDQLVSHRFPIADVSSAFSLLSSSSSSLGIVLTYPQSSLPVNRTINFQHPELLNSCISTSGNLLSVIGAGNFSARVLIPSFFKSGAHFHSLCASSGTRSVHFARRYRFSSATTDPSTVFTDPYPSAVVIATRHDSHASFILRALESGKHVYVEKPLCLHSHELESIFSAIPPNQILTVGFNRRFSFLANSLKRHLTSLSGPKAFVYTVNSGYIPDSHWTQDPVIGGGRLLGEACHFVDLLLYLSDSQIQKVTITYASDSKPCPDTFVIQILFANGSIGTVNYFSNGHKSFPKERIEVFSSGKVFRLDNFRKLQAWGIPGFRTQRLLKQDKGHLGCCSAFLQAIDSGVPPIPYSEIFDVHSHLLEALGK